MDVHSNILKRMDFLAWILSWTLRGFFNPGVAFHAFEIVQNYSLKIVNIFIFQLMQNCKNSKHHCREKYGLAMETKLLVNQRYLG